MFHWPTEKILFTRHLLQQGVHLDLLMLLEL